jgi:Cu-Zn family superoxide dismutase
MKTFKHLIALPAALTLSGLACADITVQMNAVTETGIGESLGTIVISKATHGILLTPELTGLPPGAHGFHIHEVPDCSPGVDDEGKQAAAHAAGEHYDPESTMRHGSPLVGEGHLGDLPVLMVDVGGRATMAIEASRLDYDAVDNKALVIHSGGDNYSDVPEKAGGGGARIACGIIDSTGSETSLTETQDSQLRVPAPSTNQ